MSISATFPMKTANGNIIDVPSVGFGTWAAGGTGWCKQATLAALKAGYRHLDCAWKYGGAKVDEEVGDAIRESGIPRSEIFVTTKFWPQFGAPENVEKCLNLVLKNMGLDYVDLYLAHWPVVVKARSNIASAKAFPEATNDDLAIATDGKLEGGVLDLEHSASNFAAAAGVKGSFVPTWQAMTELVATGKCRAVGVSNFSITQLQDLLPYAQDVPISSNQIEAHPWLPNDELITFMLHHDILPAVYSPFAGQKASGDMLLEDTTVKQVAQKNDMGVGQLLQSWAVMRRTIPLGKSQNEERIKANLAVRKLAEEDFEALSNLKLKGDEGRTIDYSGSFGVQFFV
ncbi:MAG: hypothetical protein M1827_004144 [Pycnora praestabilis]|nr:MAG: hypothetical protein M1827_004144 [Pycnora praestabilis]